MTEPQVPAPPPPPPPESEPVRGNPWERRAALGVVSGLIEALKLFVTSPTKAFSQTLPKGDYGSPLLFAIVVGWLGLLIGQFWDLLFGASMLSMLPADVRGQIPFDLIGAGGLMMTVIFAPVFVLVGVFLWSVILHLCLVIVGGLDRSDAGFEGTLRVVSYGSTAQLANLVPLVGDLIWWVWCLILAVIGVREIHRTSQGKAVAAVLIPVLLCCVCAAIGIFMAGVGLMGLFGNQ